MLLVCGRLPLNSSAKGRMEFVRVLVVNPNSYCGLLGERKRVNSNAACRARPPKLQSRLETLARVASLPQHRNSSGQMGRQVGQQPFRGDAGR